MAPDSPTQVAKFARRILRSHAALTEESGAAAVALPACDKLLASLRAIIGAGGCEALMWRSVAVAGAKVPWLRGLRIKVDGTLDGWAELAPKPDPATIAEAEVILLADILGLLIAFV